MLYPLCAHHIIKVDSILYQKFALWTHSPFRHEVSLLYFSRNNLLRVLLIYVDIVISNVFNLNNFFFCLFPPAMNDIWNCIILRRSQDPSMRPTSASQNTWYTVIHKLQFYACISRIRSLFDDKIFQRSSTGSTELEKKKYKTRYKTHKNTWYSISTRKKKFGYKYQVKICYHKMFKTLIINVIY